MTRKYIPVEEVAKEWMKDPEFRAEYDALDDEFALASAELRIDFEPEKSAQEAPGS
jgi:hypothetical protein